MIQTVFLLAVKRREEIITAFKLAFVVVLSLTVLSVVAILQTHPLASVAYEVSTLAGKIAIALYVLTVIPGIVRRLKLQYKLVSLLMIFRRYIGILMFCFVLFHYMVERGAMMIANGPPKTLPPAFEIFGFWSYMALLLMTVTSNDLSTKKLGVWWGRVHSVTYGVLWFIFLHVALQRISVWTLLLGVVGIAQLASFLYKAKKHV